MVQDGGKRCDGVNETVAQESWRLRKNHASRELALSCTQLV